MLILLATVISKIPRKSFDQLLDISSKGFYIFKTSDAEFSYNEVWFLDQNSKPLDLLISSELYKIVRYSVQPGDTSNKYNNYK